MPLEDPEFVHDIRAAMGAGAMALPLLMSTVVAVLDPRLRVDDLPDRPTLTQLVETLVDTPAVETTAALHVIAILTDDELLAARIRRELPNRRHPLPPDVAELAHLRIVRAGQIPSTAADGDDLVMELQGPGVSALSLLAQVDHRYGSLVKDAFVMPAGLDEVVADLRRLGAGQGHRPAFTEIGLADARARLEGAITAYETLDHGLPIGETWPGLRPLLRFLIQWLPDGGTGYPVGDPAGFLTFADDDVDDDEFIDEDDLLDEEVCEIAHDFLESPAARADAGSSPADSDLAHAFAIMEFEVNTNEYRWEPEDIEALFTEVLPVLLSGEPTEYARAPHLFAAYVRYRHARGHVEPAATDAALAAIARWTPTFEAKRDDPDVLRERASLGEEHTFDVLPGIHQLREESITRVLGSLEAAENLDVRPLPDEPLDVSGLPDDIHDRLRRIAALADGVADRFYDVEIRTASRRLLTRVARAEPDIFRRRSKDETAAAAILWIIVKANGASAGPGLPSVQQLTDALGVRSSPSQRAAPMLEAIGARHNPYEPLELGDASLLTSAVRRHIRDWLDLLAMPDPFGNE